MSPTRRPVTLAEVGVDVTDIVIDPISAVPIYQQIRDRVVELIASGQLREGDSLASVRRLSSAFGINPATVVRAYDALGVDGFVRTNRRSGTVVARDPSYDISVVDLTQWRARLHTLLAEAHAQGLPVEVVLQECARSTAAFEGNVIVTEGD